MAASTPSPLSPAVRHTWANACPDSVSAVVCDVAIPCITQSPNWWENPVICSTNCSKSARRNKQHFQYRSYTFSSQNKTVTYILCNTIQCCFSYKVLLQELLVKRNVWMFFIFFKTSNRKDNSDAKLLLLITLFSR